MLEDLKNEISEVKYLYPLLLIATVIFLIQVFLQVLSIFTDIVLIVVFAWLLSFVLDPIVYFVRRTFKISLILSTFLTFILFGALITGAIYTLIPIVSEQVQIVARLLPSYLSSAPVEVQNAVQKSLGSLTNYIYIIPSVAQFLIYFLVVLVLSFYLIIERGTIKETIFKLAPSSWHKHITFSQKVIDQTVANYMRVQVIFGILSGIMTFIVMAIFGINFAPSTSVVAGILTVIPVIGTILALIPPFFVSFVVDPSKAFFILAILLIAQQVSYNILGPKLIGGAFKIHPIIVMLSLLAGLKVAGLIGGIFAVPLVSMATIIGKEILGMNTKEKKQ
jgi:predicted PurR-regulated permease PerM